MTLKTFVLFYGCFWSYVRIHLLDVSFISTIIGNQVDWFSVVFYSAAWPFASSDSLYVNWYDDRWANVLSYEIKLKCSTLLHHLQLCSNIHMSSSAWILSYLRTVNRKILNRPWFKMLTGSNFNHGKRNKKALSLFKFDELFYYRTISFCWTWSLFSQRAINGKYWLECACVCFSWGGYTCIHHPVTFFFLKLIIKLLNTVNTIPESKFNLSRNT